MDALVRTKPEGGVSPAGGPRKAGEGVGSGHIWAGKNVYTVDEHRDLADRFGHLLSTNGVPSAIRRFLHVQERTRSTHFET